MPQSDGANHESIISTDFHNFTKNHREKMNKKAQISTNSTLLVGKLRLRDWRISVYGVR